MSDRSTYLAYRIGAGLISAFPEPVIRRLGSWAGRLAWHWARDRKAMAIRHMRRVLGEADGRAVELAAREMFQRLRPVLGRDALVPSPPVR